VAPRFPFPLPDGWFCVACSEELAPGAVRPLRYFGEDLVLFRTQSGRAHVFDAHCVHLGAHLGHGGCVEGETLRCPFHAWRYDGDGRCVEIPYARKIPARARMRAWSVRETAGRIMVWRHAGGEPPGWELPEVPEYGHPEWTPFEQREWKVRSRNQELAENTVDQAHFRYVHRTNTVAETEFETQGPLLRVVSKSLVQTPRGETQGTIEIEAHGFGFGVTRFKGVVETLVLTTGTPIDEESVHMRLGLSVRRLANSDATRGVGRAFIAEIERQFAEDIPIWEHKAHHERPLLCDGDGPIGALRRWGRQFYSAAPQAGTQEPADRLRASRT
jgi:phenylpropionate dioxygenase-like ring-hydroxylating dioxygenase large terminal subunit